MNRLLAPLVVLTAMGTAFAAADTLKSDQDRSPDSAIETTDPANPSASQRTPSSPGTGTNSGAAQEGLDSSQGAKEQSSAPPGSDAHREMPNKNVDVLEDTPSAPSDINEN